MVNAPAQDAPQARPEAPAGEAGAPLDTVLRILAASDRVTAKMRQSAQRAAAAVRPGEPVIGAYRCGVSVGTSEREGVAVVTSERLSVFDRRGWVSVDQGFQHRWSTPFTVGQGAGPTLVTITPTGASSISLDLIDPQRAEEFCRQLEAFRPTVEGGEEGEPGWWSQVQAWPGSLGSPVSWSYLGGDSRLPEPEVGLGLQIGPGGVTLAEAEKTLLLAAWQDVRFIHVVGLETAFQRAAAGGLTGSPTFAGPWSALQEDAALAVIGYAGEEAFFATTDVTATELRARLIPVAAAMPAPAADDRPAVPPTPAMPAAPAVPPAPAVAATSAAHASSGTADLATQLERIAALHERGLLDDAEFARAKAALFS
jgi:hypothetical protein